MPPVSLLTTLAARFLLCSVPKWRFNPRPPCGERLTGAVQAFTRWVFQSFPAA